MAFESDLPFIYKTSEFALEATFQGNVINVIFDNEGFAIHPYTGELDKSDLIIHAITSDVTGIKDKDTITINSIIYEVKKAIPNGEGETLITVLKQ